LYPSALFAACLYVYLLSQLKRILFNNHALFDDLFCLIIPNPASHFGVVKIRFLSTNVNDYFDLGFAFIAFVLCLNIASI